VLRGAACRFAGSRRPQHRASLAHGRTSSRVRRLRAVPPGQIRHADGRASCSLSPFGKEPLRGVCAHDAPRQQRDHLARPHCDRLDLNPAPFAAPDRINCALGAARPDAPRRRACVLLPFAVWKNSPSVVCPHEAGGGWGLPSAGEPTVHPKGWPLPERVLIAAAGRDPCGTGLPLCVSHASPVTAQGEAARTGAHSYRRDA
jgi:hypothetical protein